MSDKKTQAFPEGAEFVSEIFSGISVEGQTLTGVVFEDCGFNSCNFSDAVFSGCKFVDCTFTNSNCCNVKIRDTKFSNIEFVECKVLGVDWTRAKWPRVPVGALLKFRKCMLTDSTFFGLALEESVIEACKAHGVDFREANLTRSKLSDTDFRNALFGKTNLTEVDFSGATSYAIDIFDNQIDRARFTRDEALNLLSSLDIELVD